MKILFITHYDNMYGANQALYRLIRCLKTVHEEEPMLVIPATGEMTEEMDKLGVPCLISPITQWQGVYTTPGRFLIKKMIRRKAIAREVESLYLQLKDQNIDVIHSNSSVIGTGAMLASKLGCRHIWHIREFSREHFHMKYFYGMRMVRRLYESADYVIAISDALKMNYLEKYPKANIIRIYDGVNWNFVEETQTKERALDAPIRFCYLGYLFPMKHQLEVLEGCRQLNQSGFTNYEFWLIGDGKEKYQKKLRKMIKQYNLTQVKMPGYVENAALLLNTMDVGVIASEYEGFGLVTVEYMLHGLPVIGYRSGGTVEIIQDGITGCLVHSREEFVAAMKYMMENQERRTRMGEAGKERAKVCFTEEQNASLIAQVYEKIRKGAI